MDQKIRSQFNPAILSAALQLYRIDAEQVSMLDGFESFIFDVVFEDKAHILRIGHDSRRTVNHVIGESEFLNYLAVGGLSVPRVQPSVNNRLVESLPAANGTHFLATLFTKAPGRPPSKADWQPALFDAMGKYLGKLHALSKSFTPSQTLFKRYDIEDDFAEMEATGRRYLSQPDQPILQVYLEIVQSIQQLPKDSESYGLCHVDFHGGNFFITEDGSITLFDFDDCQYAWFIYDIAMAFFYVLPHDCTSKNDLHQAAEFLSHFWKGYQKENHLDSMWFEQIPHFLKLREADLYMIIHRSMDINNLDPWCASYMANRRDKLLKNIPYCDIDYTHIR